MRSISPIMRSGEEEKMGTILEFRLPNVKAHCRKARPAAEDQCGTAKIIMFPGGRITPRPVTAKSVEF